MQQRDPEFVSSYMAQRDRILRDGAIPAKYKLLMTMIVDALLSHPDGVANIAARARGVSRVRAVLKHARIAETEGETVAASRIFEDMGPVMRSEDAKEGVRSFMERRAAKFTGR